MNLTNKYTIPIKGININRILETWRWLIGNDKSIIALTKAGDIILKGDDNILYFLDVGFAEIELISNDHTDFFDQLLDEETYEHLLLPSLVDQLEQVIGPLKPGQVFSYTVLPILGGEYEPENMYALDLYHHYGMNGDLHFQIKDLPDGSPVKIDVVD